jgi:hypothetical protein
VWVRTTLFLNSPYLTTAESAATESACAVVVESTDVESATAVSDLEPPHADKTTIVATKANANTFFILLIVYFKLFYKDTKTF